MKIRVLLILFVFFSATQQSLAVELPQLKVSVLHTGTVNWELQHMINEGLDRKYGFQLNLHKVASLSAARLALTSDSTDMIVSDWLWAGKRNAAGEKLRFIPFSSQIGGVMSADDKPLTDLNSLKGKRIGVAGGPLNKSWVLLQTAARKQGVDLSKEAQVQFGAPPLLSQALKNQQVDLLLTFWHFAARLETEGYHSVLSLSAVMQELGMGSRVPMLGYLYDAELDDTNAALISGFSAALRDTKQALNRSDRAWDKLRPLMKADSEEVFAALVKGYRAGTPEPISLNQVEDAAYFYQLIDQLKSHPEGAELDKQLFRRPGQ